MITFSFLTELMGRGAVIALAGGFLWLALHRVGTAGQRAQGLRLTLAALILLPLMVAMAPRWVILPTLSHRPTVSADEDSSIYVSDRPRLGSFEGASAPAATPPVTHTDTNSPWFSWKMALLGLYGTGVLCGILPCVLAYRRLRVMRRHSSSCENERIAGAAKKAQGMVGCSTAVDVRLSKHSIMPMTWGWRRPVILLPEASKSWPEERLLAVIAHECSHIQRRDSFTALCAQIARSLHWPNPIVWWMVHRWRVDMERACDDQVVASGIKASDYATALHHLARSCHLIRRSNLAALPMAGRTALEDRIHRILGPAVPTSRLANMGEVLFIGIFLTAGVVAQEGATPNEPEIPPKDVLQVVDESWTPGGKLEKRENEDASDRLMASRHEKRLRDTIVPSIELGPVILEEAVQTLEQLAAKHDPRDIPVDRKGSNFLVDRKRIAQSAPDSLTKRISIKMKNTPMIEMLELVAEKTGLTFDVEPYAVIIGPRKPGEDRKQDPLESSLKKTEPAEGYIIHSPSKDRQTVVNRALCERDFPPYSTYKIPNSMLALELGLVTNLDETVPYKADLHPKQDWWPNSWTREHSLRSAFKHSVVWYYRDLAAQMNLEPINSHLREWHYGRATTVSKENRTNYWLGNGLTITAHEQVRFLRRFHENRLGLDPETTAKIKSIAFVEERDGKRLHAKTGTGDLDHLWLAWYVGWIEDASGDDPYYFALLCLDHSFDEVRKRRQSLKEKVFREMGFH